MRKTPTGVAAAAAIAGGGMLVGRLLGYRLGRHTAVRCRAGHVFETTWIPGVNLRSLDLVVARVQRCPVGNHWSIVTPVRGRDLHPSGV